MGPSAKELRPTIYVYMKQGGVRKKSESGDGEVAVIRSGSLSPESRASRRKRIL